MVDDHIGTVRTRHYPRVQKNKVGTLVVLVVVRVPQSVHLVENQLLCMHHRMLHVSWSGSYIVAIRVATGGRKRVVVVDDWSSVCIVWVESCRKIIQIVNVSHVQYAKLASSGLALVVKAVDQLEKEGWPPRYKYYALPRWYPDLIRIA